MADINAAFVIEDGLAFDETQTGIFAGANDPSSGAGEPAPVGSLFVRASGELYVKTGAADTDWQFILRQPDVTFDGLAPTTTKGDLIVRNATGNVRLAVGSNNYVLTADTASPTGVKWAPSASMVQSNATGEPTGFPNRTDSSISFNNGTRIFTIAPTGAQFSVWLKGVEYIKTAPEQVQLPDVSGPYFISYQGLGILTLQTVFFPLDTCAPVSVIYWNADQQKAVLFAEERHGLTMDWATHEYLHVTRGSQYGGGFDITTQNLGGNNDASAQAGLTGGHIFDEDLELSVVADTTPTLQFQQDIGFPGKFPIIYKLGNPGIWYREAATAFPVKKGVARALYNQNVGGTWQLTEASNNNYTAMWLVATNDVDEPVVAVMGEAEFTSLSQAQGGEKWPQIFASGLPYNELRPLWRLIYETKNSYTNAVGSILVDALDLRATSILTVSDGGVTDHGSLTGLEDDDHLQYVHVSSSRTITAQHSFSPAAAQAPFTLGANAQGQLVTGFNADLLDGLHAASFQPIDPDLTSIAGLSTLGIAVRSATNTWTLRSIAGSAGRITVTNANGVSGNPTLDLSSVGTAGTYTQVTTDAYGRVVVGNNPTTLAGYGITDAQPLDNELTAIANLSTLGFITLTGAGTAASRTIQGTAGKIVVSDGDGVLGDPTITLATVGSAGTWGNSTNIPVFTTDAHGRVTAVTNTGVNWPVSSVFGRTGAVTAQEGDYTLDKLGDVVISAPVAGQILSYDGAVWSNTSTAVNLQDPGGNGIVIRTGAGITTFRSVVGGTGISVADGDGISGDITITNTGVTSLTGTVGQIVVSSPTGAVNLGVGTELAGLAALNTTGFVARTGPGTYITRAIKLYAENPTTGQATATGNDAVAIGDLAQAQADRSLAIGAHAVTRTPGAINAAAGRIQSSGDAQGGTYYLKAVTTNALAKELFMDGPSGTQRAVLADDSTWMFTMHITAHRTDDVDGHAGWFVKGVIYRGAGAATTAMQGRAHVEVVAKSNAAWDINIGVNTVDGGLAIVATGEAGKTIRWLARLETAELTN